MKNVNVKDAIKEAKELDKKYNIFITINNPRENEGIPVAVKDNICTKDLQTTAGSKILQNYIPPFDATVVEKIKSKNCFIVGKTAQDEFGFGTFSTNCAYKIPKNPFDINRSCGGSSGGAAAYVALSKYSRFGIGQSTGGSISCPASFCGVVGLTPTYGLVSRYGLIDYANSLDKIGPIGKTVKDAATLLSWIAGHDPKDSTSLKEKQKDYGSFCNKDVKNLKIGVPKEYFTEGVNEKIKSSVWDAIKVLESNGANYQEISLSFTKYALPAYYIIAMSEASTNLAKFCGMRYGLHLPLKENFNEYFSEVREEGFGKEAKRRILLGTFTRMAGYRNAYYIKALKVKSLIIKDFKQAFKKVDVIAAPTMPILPLKFSEINDLTPLQVYALDILTTPPNLAGIPTISVPANKVNGLPVGFHLMADYLQEEKIIRVADYYERAK